MSLDKRNDSDNAPIVFDASSRILKAGFAGDLLPTALFPSQGAFRPWTPDIYGGSNLCGPKINSLFPGAPPSFLSSYKDLSNEDALTMRWNYIIKEGLRTDFPHRSLLFIEPPNRRPSDRKKIAKVLFGKMSCPAIAFVDSALTSYLSMGRHTCFIVEFSAERITVTPFIGIWRIEEASLEMKARGIRGTFPRSISELILDSINRCPIDTRKDLIHNIMLVGGSADITGLDVRLAEELLHNLSEPNWKRYLQVIKPQNIHFCAWIGGSIIASLKTFHNCWLTEEEYNGGEFHKRFLSLNDKGFFYPKSD